jgi:site-specific recombinase XerD
MHEELKDPTLTLPHTRMKDHRHSFATALLGVTKDLRLVAEFLDIT